MLKQGNLTSERLLVLSSQCQHLQLERGKDRRAAEATVVSSASSRVEGRPNLPEVCRDGGTRGRQVVSDRFRGSVMGGESDKGSANV
jgi:hypothetical protein